MFKKLQATCFAACVAVLAVPMAQAQNWQLMWGDEFDYTGYPAADKWQPEVWNPGRVNNELQAYTANLDNASVSNGTLKIKAAAWRNPATGQNQYYSARLNSKVSWTYGRFEARLKLPGGYGTWPAFWMFPDNMDRYGKHPLTNSGWPNSGELDIMENVGYDPNTIFGSTHTACCFFMMHTERQGRATVSNPQDWHTYAMEWFPDRVSFFVDGYNYYTLWNDGTGYQSWPFDHPYHIILNLAVGGDWGGAKGVDPNIWPRTLEVDYVRAYKRVNSQPIHIEAESLVATNNVKTEACTEGGLNVGWINSGSWMVWNTNIPTSGEYMVEYRIASLNGGGLIQLEKAGGSVQYGSLSVGKTSGWQNWKTISHKVRLTAGQQSLAIYAPVGGYNINWIKLTPL